MQKRCRYAFAVLICIICPTLGGCAADQSTIAGIRSPSWIDPSAVRKGNLLYIADDGTNSVYVYTYPGGKQIGKLTIDNASGGICSDTSGNVYVIGSGQVLQYAHGGTTPLETLTAAYGPQDCAADPRSGDLAVANFDASVSIYLHAKGAPHTYTFSDPSYKVNFFNCTYDGSSNLYVDAEFSPTQPTGNYGFSVLEMPKGSHRLRVIWSPEGFASTGFPGGLQWDGKQLAVGDANANPSRVYLRNGNVITLNDSSYMPQFWLRGRTLIGATGGSGGTVGYWKYPGGGNPTKTINGFEYAYSATVSVYPKGL